MRKRLSVGTSWGARRPLCASSALVILCSAFTERSLERLSIWRDEELNL